MQRVLCLAGLVCSMAVLVWTPAAAAGDVTCDGFLFGPVAGNVVVPRDTECVLSFAEVSGNVTAQSGADVLALNSTIGGNYTCNNCAFADSTLSTIGGNYQVSGARFGATVDTSTIRGNLQIQTSGAELGDFDIGASRIGGNLSFNNNRGSSFITDNTIGGNLTCQNNAPPPVSSGNTARSAKGQCTA